MIINVKMEAFAHGKIREVVVPVTPELWGDMPLIEKLDAVFYWGQNDFQPQNICSVSVGDVILLEGNEHRVEMFGFSKKAVGGYASGHLHCDNTGVWVEI